MRDNEFMEDDIEMDDLMIKNHLNEALSFKGITVSEDLINRTLAAVQKDGLQSADNKQRNGMAQGDTVENLRNESNYTKDIIDISGLNSTKKLSIKKVFQYSSIVAASILLLVGLSSGLGNLGKKSSSTNEARMNDAMSMDTAGSEDIMMSANVAEESSIEEGSSELSDVVEKTSEGDNSRIESNTSADIYGPEASSDKYLTSVTATANLDGSETETGADEAKYGVSNGKENQFASSSIVENTEEESINTMGKEDRIYMFVGVERIDVDQVTIYDLQNQKDVLLDEVQIDQFYSIMKRSEYKKIDSVDANGMEDSDKRELETVEKETPDENTTEQETSNNTEIDNQSKENSEETTVTETIMGYQVNIVRKSDPNYSVILWIGSQLEIIDTIDENPSGSMGKYSIIDYHTILDGISEFFQ